MQNVAFRILGVRQADLSVAHSGVGSLWLHLNAFFLPTQLTPMDTLFIQNTAEKENIGDYVVYVKTETKSFTQNAYFAHFLERDIYQRCTRVSQKRVRYLERHFKLF